MVVAYKKQLWKLLGLVFEPIERIINENIAGYTLDCLWSGISGIFVFRYVLWLGVLVNCF